MVRNNCHKFAYIFSRNDLIFNKVNREADSIPVKTNDNVLEWIEATNKENNQATAPRRSATTTSNWKPPSNSLGDTYRL